MKKKHGETDLPEKFKARIPVVGTLKIGDVEMAGDKARPKKLDYFRLCGASATAKGTYPDHPKMADFNKEHSRSLTVELVSDDPSVNLEVVYAVAGRGAILCRGNGASAERRLDARGAMIADAPFQPVAEGTCGEKCEFFKKNACKLASTLRFRIPGHTDLGAVWQFRSTSWNSCSDLLGAMEAISGLTGGVLARIPLKLFMTEQRRQALTDRGRSSTNFWSLGLSYEGDEEALIAAVAKATKLKADMAALAMPTLEDRLKAQEPELLSKDLEPLEEAAIAAEFFPGMPTTFPVETAEGAVASTDQEPPAGEAGAIHDAEGPTPSSNAVGDPAASEGEAHSEASPSPNPESEPAASPASVPFPPSTEPKITGSQSGLILKHSGRVKGLDRKALETLLKGKTKKEASALITEVLADAEGAFKKLGVVA